MIEEADSTFFVNFFEDRRYLSVVQDDAVGLDDAGPCLVIRMLGLCGQAQVLQPVSADFAVKPFSWCIECLKNEDVVFAPLSNQSMRKGI